MTNETQATESFDLDTLRQALPSSSNTNLPPVLAQQDMLRIIGNLLPMYHFMGSKFNLQRVCKQWKKEFESGLWDHKKTRQALTQCSKQAENCLPLLSDFSLCSQMSLKRILKLAANHEELALAILNDIEIVNLLDSHAVAILASTKGFVARKLLNITAFREAFTVDDLALIGAHQASICYEFIAQFKENRQVYGLEFGVVQWVMLCHYHLGCAINLLGSETLYSLLSLDNVVAIASRHQLLAFELLNSEKPGQPLKGHQLCLLGQNHEEIALMILQDENKVARLNDYEIALIACRHEKVCDYVLNTPALRNQLKPDSLVKLGSVSARIANKILNSELDQSLSDDDHIELYSYHLPLALKLVKSLAKLSLNADHLFLLCKRQPRVLNIVFANSELYSKFKSPHLIGLAEINIAASLQICSSGNIRNLSDEALAQMHKNIELCTKISVLANHYYQISLNNEPANPKIHKLS